MITWQVSPLGHRFVDSKIRLETLDDFNNELASTFYPGFSRYCKCPMFKINIQANNSQTGLTKLMNILWTNELQKRLDANGVPIITLSIHPGNVNTFADQLPMFRTVAKVIMGLFFKTWDQGAYNSVIGAALPAVRENPEKYKAAYIERDYGKVVKPSELAMNDEAAATLWKITENFVRGLDIY